jgi:hypothetical protein
MRHTRRLGVIVVCTLLGACSWHRNEPALSYSYQPSPLPRVRTQTPVLDDSTRKHLWLGDMVAIARGCDRPPGDSLPQVPVKLRGRCVLAEFPQSDP